MIEVTVEIINSVLEVTCLLPRVGVAFSGIRDNVINGNQITLLDTVI